MKITFSSMLSTFVVHALEGTLVSLSATPTEIGDGVYAVGDSGMVLVDEEYQTDTIYLSTEGEDYTVEAGKRICYPAEDIVVWGGNAPDRSPFKVSGKGGGGSGGDNTHYKGTTTTAISNGSTTNPITIDGESYTAVFGDIVVYGYTEFVFDGTTWSEFGRPFDTAPTSGSANAVTSDGIYQRTPWTRGTGTYSANGGRSCTSSGDSSIAYGYNSKATNYYTSAFGYGATADMLYMTAVGNYNTTHLNNLFVVGNGTSPSNRSNILEVNRTEMDVNGDIKRDGVGIDDYTTTERKIGKWIDGSDLYQRTFEVTGLTNNGVWNQRILGTSDIDIVDWIGYLEYEDGNHVKQRYPIDFKSGEYDGCCISVISDLTLMAKITPLTLIKAVITIKYTKPSVQANIQQTEEPTDEMR